MSGDTGVSLSFWGLLGLRCTARRAPQEIDSAYSEIACPSPEQRLAWKVLRDPAYQHLYRTVPSQKLLAAAGFFDDKLNVGAETLPCWTEPRLGTPYSKLLASLDTLGPDTEGLVLLTTGGFSPVHQGHLALMERAKQYLENKGRRVLGGYLSPSHDDYVSTKQGGTAHLPIAHRLALCHEAVADSPWLMVDPWEARFAPVSLNFTDVARRLRDYITKMFPTKNIKVVYVFGSDNLGFLAAQMLPEHGDGSPEPALECLCVERDSLTKTQTLLLAEIRQAGWPGELVPNECEGPVMSSTQIRAGDVSGLPQRCRARYAGLKPTASANVAPLAYLVRDDLRWATAPWGVSAKACETFVSKLCVLLQQAFETAEWPDSASQVNVHRLSRDQQHAYVRELERHECVLSTDATIPAKYNLEISRQFGLADGQVFSKVLDARPLSAPLNQQVARLPRTPVTVVEDDISSGETWAAIQRFLEGRSPVRKLELLNQWSMQKLGMPLSTSVHDIVDARDFLLGAKEGGLVVTLPSGKLTRAPYVMPWVCNVFRSKIPPSSELGFSLGVWELNAYWFKTFGPQITLRDLPLSCRQLLCEESALDSTPVWRVAERHLKVLRAVGIAHRIHA
jgi:hypothetical protein